MTTITTHKTTHVLTTEHILGECYIDFHVEVAVLGLYQNHTDSFHFSLHHLHVTSTTSPVLTIRLKSKSQSWNWNQTEKVMAGDEWLPNY